MVVTEADLIHQIASNPPSNLVVAKNGSQTPRSEANDTLSKFWPALVQCVNQEVAKCHIVNVSGIGQFYLPAASGQFIAKFVPLEPIRFCPSTRISTICAGAIETGNIPSMPDQTYDLRPRSISHRLGGALSESECRVVYEGVVRGVTRAIEAGATVTLNFGAVGVLSLSRTAIRFSAGRMKPSRLAYDIPNSVGGSSRADTPNTSRPASKMQNSKFDLTSGVYQMLAPTAPLSARLPNSSSPRKGVPGLDLSGVGSASNTVNVLASGSQTERALPVMERQAVEARSGFYSSRGPALPFFTYESSTNRDLEKRLYRKQKGRGVKTNSLVPKEFGESHKQMIEIKAHQQAHQRIAEIQQDRELLKAEATAVAKEFQKLTARRLKEIENAQDSRVAAQASKSGTIVPFTTRYQFERNTNATVRVGETPGENKYFPFVGNDQNVQRHKEMDATFREGFLQQLEKNENREAIHGTIFGSPAKNGERKSPRRRVADIHPYGQLIDPVAATSLVLNIEVPPEYQY